MVYGYMSVGHFPVYYSSHWDTFQGKVPFFSVYYAPLFIRLGSLSIFTFNLVNLKIKKPFLI